MLLRCEESMKEVLYTTNALVRVLLAHDQESLAAEVLNMAFVAGDGVTLGDRCLHLGFHDELVERDIREHRNHIIYLAGMKKWVDWDLERHRVMQSDAAIRFQKQARNSSSMSAIRLAEVRNQDYELLRETVKLEAIQTEVVRISLDFLQQSGWRDVNEIPVQHAIFQQEEKLRRSDLAAIRGVHYAVVLIELCKAFEFTYDVEAALSLAKLIANDDLKIYQDIAPVVLQDCLKKLQRLAGGKINPE
ncbi:unnamed protein product, partial [Mesorhabditis spiculigera]